MHVTEARVGPIPKISKAVARCRWEVIFTFRGALNKSVAECQI
jgi:hypothetical protein